ncbi:hypothetical protein N864_21885 [Intrasporangium chromatireducens Q5-1]|uniref:Uncharacterized protein n=1 Tax=Intrasporangium chromatireducens Q5-1 TaxID=584657 RepID=W9GR71_9MICO|nr:hypothetical protein N864_21885 [Intrasporangium chromatireducens Q5-1]
MIDHLQRCCLRKHVVVLDAGNVDALSDSMASKDGIPPEPHLIDPPGDALQALELKTQYLYVLTVAWLCPVRLSIHLAPSVAMSVAAAAKASAMPVVQYVGITDRPKEAWFTDFTSVAGTASVFPISLVLISRYGRDSSVQASMTLQTAEILE